MTEERKKNIRWHFLSLAILLWIAVLSWMVLIFILSAEPGHISANRSADTTEMINRYLGADLSENVVRKLAHVMLFSTLTILSYSAFASTFRISIHKSIIQRQTTDIKEGFQINALLSMWITVLYAAIDEYHQVFVPGRNGSVFDLLLNISAGVAVLIVLRLFIALGRLIFGKKEADTV